jgi:hypothetical protein
MSESTFTPEAAKAALSVHGWTRFAALLTGTVGALVLIGTLFLAGTVSAKYPQLRGLITIIGTAYAISGMAMLCFAFLLVRYGQKLELASKQRSAGPLVDALPYENAIWAIVAGYVVIVVLSMVISIASPTARSQFPIASDTAVPSPIEVEDPAGVLQKINWICGGFGVVGLTLVIAALRPVD